MRIVYGVDLVEENDIFFRRIEDVAAVSAAIAIPGNFSVEAVPALRYLPSWVPGGGFKKYAADAKVLFSHTLDTLFRGALNNIVRFSALFMICTTQSLTNECTIAH